MAWLLDRDSPAYASNQFRALQQFFKWLAGEDEVPDPMAGLKPPHVPDKPLPVFADSGLTRLERACAGRSFQRRRDIALWQREITVRGKGGKTRTVKIGLRGRAEPGPVPGKSSFTSDVLLPRLEFYRSIAVWR
jgi:site-specific recombinase XerC